jgi:hypothetical protein
MSNSEVEHIPAEKRSRKLGQIFTPPVFVERMLNLLPIWNLPTEQLATQRFLEPAMGNGNFIVAIISRLVDRLTETGLTPAQAFHHAMERQIWGVELDMPIYAECLQRIDNLARSYGTRLGKHHLIQGDGLEFMARVREQRPAEAQQLELHV